jgi:hypothetical protein
VAAGRARVVAAGGLILLNAAALHCRSRATPPPDLTAVVSVEELMNSLIDPVADNIFDAVATDVTEKGVVEIEPTTDEDWAGSGKAR